MEYSVFIIICQVYIGGRHAFPVEICQFGCKGKCLGNPARTMDNGIPNADAGLFLTSKTSVYDDCANLCRSNVRCFMGAFISANKTCNMYRKISYEGTTDDTIRLFRWYCCDTNSSYNTPNRCPGFWRNNLRSRSDNTIRSSDPLVELKGVDQYECPMECLKNSICGAVNILNQDIINRTVISCQLIIQFPVEDLTFINDDRWGTYQWQCADNYTLPAPSTECAPRVNHPRGYWIVENTSVILGSETKNLLFFHTFDYRQCLLNCALYQNCKRAWYSAKSLNCVLEAVKDEKCAESTVSKGYNFTTYVWKICYTSQPEAATMKSKEAQCRTLVDNNHTYIYPIKCGHPPTDISSLYPCWKSLSKIYGTVYSHNLHCQANQSFRVFDKLDSPPIFLPNVTWQRAFTGYESFWLVNVTDVNFIATDNTACEIFDASMDVSNIPPPRIIKKTEWFPARPSGPEPSFPKHPAIYVVITNTDRPICNCFSVEACSATMRLIDRRLRSKFYSIPYNFVVTGDGTVYEAKGWDLMPQIVTAQYNPYSLSIALCGRYYVNPGVPALSSVKQLIKMAIDLNKVDKNYTLYITNDIRNGNSPHEGLRRVFELWPHYRGHRRVNCGPMRDITIVINIISILVCSLLLILFYNEFLYTIWHKKNCRLVRKGGIEKIYSNICDKSREVLPLIIMYDVHYLSLEETWVSPFTSPVFWIEDRLPICGRSEDKDLCSCRSAIFSLFDLCRLKSKLVNVGSLSLFPEVRYCRRTVSFIFQRNVELGKESLLILHLTNVRSFYRCISQLYLGKCVCNNFHLTQYSTQLQNFVTEFSHTDAIRNLNKKSISRSHLGDKYTLIVGPDGTLRYYC